MLSLIFAELLTEADDPDTVHGGQLIRQLNILERSLATVAGLSCLTLAALVLVHSGAIPLTASLSAHDNTPSEAGRKPTLAISAAFFGALAYLSWFEVNMKLVAVVSGFLALWGGGSVFFAHESRVNKAGKSTSGFPFKNEHAEKAKDPAADQVI